MRIYLSELARGVTVALCIMIVVLMAAVGCSLNRHHGLYDNHAVHGIRAPGF